MSRYESVSACRRGGFTLLEIVVVFVILGIATAVVVPPLISPRAATVSDVERLIDAARRAAIERAESLTLSVAANGAWVLEGRGATSRDGTVSWPYATGARLHISALGACMLDALPASERPLRIDPVHCTLLE